jgi:hypothetical protein
MEWMLQVIDEIDDAVGALRLYYLGVAAEIGLLAAAALGIAAIFAAIAAGAEVPLIFSAAIVLSLAAALKIHGSRLHGNR